MPSAPPSSRVVSFTAEPTPAFDSGTALMISPVAGAAVMPMPAPSTAKATASTRYGVSGVSEAQDDEAAGDDDEPGRHHRAGAEAGGEHRAAGRHGDEHDRERQQREARFQRRVAAARTAGTACVRKKKPNITKKATVTTPLPTLNRRSRKKRERQHRVLAAALPADERRERRRPRRRPRRPPASSSSRSLRPG